MNSEFHVCFHKIPQLNSILDKFNPIPIDVVLKKKLVVLLRNQMPAEGRVPQLKTGYDIVVPGRHYCTPQGDGDR